MGNLYIVATPIGNLGDISLRTLEVLKSVDFVLCEDTRVTQKLFNHYEIKTPTISYHEHSGVAKVEKVIELLQAEKNLALVSDAGTPGISDPGDRLIEELDKKYRVNSVFNSVLNIVPIPGPSALTTAASITGFPMDKFIFLGFPPVKKKRQKFFLEVSKAKYPVVLYESPHRIIKTLEAIADTVSTRQLVVCRELTKKFETIYRGTARDIIEELQGGEVRGEFVVVISNV